MVSIQDGTIVGVSDDFFKDKLGTIYATLENSDGSEWIVEFMEVPDHDNEYDVCIYELDIWGEGNEYSHNAWEDQRGWS